MHKVIEWGPEPPLGARLHSWHWKARGPEPKDHLGGHTVTGKGEDIGQVGRKEEIRKIDTGWTTLLNPLSREEVIVRTCIWLPHMPPPTDSPGEPSSLRGQNDLGSLGRNIPNVCSLQSP